MAELEQLEERLDNLTKMLEERFGASLRSSNAPVTGTISINGNFPMSGTVQMPDSGGSGSSTQGTAPWAWNQLYLDPPNYTQRVLQPGFNGVLPIARGAYPPGYKVPDQKTKGGVYPTGTSDGTRPIVIQPPPKGTGRLKYVCQWKMLVQNNSNQDGSFTAILGTLYSSQNSKPLYPYLGVAHDQNDLSGRTVKAGTSVLAFLHRLDIVDNDFQSGAIPNWPNWEMDLAASGNMMYPALQPTMANTGKVPLTILDLHIFGFAC